MKRQHSAGTAGFGKNARSQLLKAGVVAAAFAALALTPLQAQPDFRIQFDFNSAFGVYDGINAPGHAAGDFSATDSVWNAVNGDSSGGFFQADGTAVSGITFDFGVSPNSTSAVDWDASPNLGVDATAEGVFASTLGQDNFWITENRKIGVRINGLAPGIYNVYAIGRGITSGQLGISYNQSIGINLSDISGTQPSLGPSTDGAATWTAGATYQLTQVVVTDPGDWITFISQMENDTDNDGAHAVQGIQIVAVPEPRAFLLTALGLGMLALFRRRKAGPNGPASNR
jgi:hypothetical protein